MSKELFNRLKKEVSIENSTLKEYHDTLISEIVEIVKAQEAAILEKLEEKKNAVTSAAADGRRRRRSKSKKKSRSKRRRRRSRK